MKKATLICDMQFGSTGKGLIAGYLAERDSPDTIVTAWAANAGHTYIDRDGRKYVHTMLANGIVSTNLKRLMLGGGSLLNLDSLRQELEECSDMLSGKEGFEGVYIHESAAVIQNRHRDWEKTNMVGIGSTSKGVGAALSDKISRRPDGKRQAITAMDVLGEHQYLWGGTFVQVVRHSEYVKILKHRADVIQIEGAQGYSLGINSGFYPYCTSRECTPRQIMVDCNIPATIEPKVVGCLRTYPIRVANRFDEKGNQIGYSGNGYGDQDEISWDDIGIKPELTTVTKLPRRIFNWSDEQFLEAVEMVNPDEIFLNFVNYVKSKHQLTKLLKRVPVTYIGLGATVNDVYDVSRTMNSNIVKLVDIPMGEIDE